MFIDTCNGRQQVFSVAEVNVNAVISQVKYPTPHEHQGFLFSKWSETAKQVLDLVQAGKIKPGD